MKPLFALRLQFAAAITLSLIGITPLLLSQPIVIPSDGSDGALDVSGNTVIDLSRSLPGNWDSPSASPTNGTYDSTQWAVVFKYSSVTIESGATLSFLNNPTHAPVVWLVQSNVTINGMLNLNGQSPLNGATTLAEPGPGGFRGSLQGGQGLGPGGSPPSPATYTGTYGNPQIQPLVGGSGATGPNGSLGGGGGAILIAAGGTIAVNAPGMIQADGGASASGGGIRLVASQILGSGRVEAYDKNQSKSDGQIRIESTNIATVSLSLKPTPSTLILNPGEAPIIFPSATNSTVSIVAVVWNGITTAVPTDPHAAISSTGNDDVRVVTTNQVTIQIQSMNFPTNGTVAVYVKPIGSTVSGSPLTAIFDGGSSVLGNWHVMTSLPYPAHTVLQARGFY